MAIGTTAINPRFLAWSSRHSRRSPCRLRCTAQASSNRPAFALVSNKNMDGLMTLTDGDTQVRFDRPGVVLFSYHQDIRHNCGYLWGQAVINHDRSGATVISRELISNTRGLVCFAIPLLFGFLFFLFPPPS